MSDEIENRVVAGAQDEYDRLTSRTSAEEAEHEALAGEVVSALMAGEDTDPADFTDLLVEVAEDEDFPAAVLETLRELPAGELAALVRRHADRIADERADELISTQREEGEL